MLERGWLGGGNTGRNTTIVRSNYFYPESAGIYDLSLRLYEGLSRQILFSLRIRLHSPEPTLYGTSPLSLNRCFHNLPCKKNALQQLNQVFSLSQTECCSEPRQQKAPQHEGQRHENAEPEIILGQRLGAHQFAD